MFYCILKKQKTACLVTLFLCAVSSISAQNSPDSVRALQEVVVTERQFKEVIPAQKLSGKELEALNTFSVADAIRFFSGVQLKDYGGIGGLKTVNIRSMGTNQVGVFYNGIQLGNAQNGQVDLGKFSMDNIEEISLYNGQKSEIFQSARDFGFASSIYLTTRKPQFKEGKSTNVRARFKAGSFSLINPSLLMEYQISDRLSMSFGGEWMESTGKYKVHYRRTSAYDKNEILYDTTAIRENGDIKAARLEASLYGTLPEGSWNIQAYNYSSDRGVPGAIVNNVWSRGERIGDANSFVQGHLNTVVTPRWTTQLNVKYASDYTHFENLNETYYYVNNRYRQKEFYVSSANLFPITRHWDASLSYDFQRNDLKGDLPKVSGYDRFEYPTRYSHWLAAATAFDWKRFKTQASVQGVFVHETVKRGDNPKDRNEFSPAVFASYKLLPEEDLHLRAFYKKIFRMATFNEMYYVEVVSADVKPEFATQYNVGFKYTKGFSHPFLKFLDVQVDAYYNEVRDKIISLPKSPLFRWSTLNLGYVEIRGIDVSLANIFQVSDVQLHTKLQYTYQKAQDFTDPTKTYYGDQIPYIPWHSGTAIVSASYKKWALNYSFIYTGERHYESFNHPRTSIQPWYTSDMSLVWNFRIENLDFKATAEVNNLLDQNYEVVMNYPMPKRNYMVSLTVNL